MNALGNDIVEVDKQITVLRYTTIELLHRTFQRLACEMVRLQHCKDLRNEEKLHRLFMEWEDVVGSAHASLYKLSTTIRKYVNHLGEATNELSKEIQKEGDAS